MVDWNLVEALGLSIIAIFIVMAIIMIVLEFRK